jgi:hypothetical protein
MFTFHGHFDWDIARSRTVPDPVNKVDEDTEVLTESYNDYIFLPCRHQLLNIQGGAERTHVFQITNFIFNIKKLSIPKQIVRNAV